MAPITKNRPPTNSLVDFQSLDDEFTIAATTPTGFEKYALSEVKEKLLVTSFDIVQGKIYFKIDRHSIDKLHLLKSVDNLYLVVKHFHEYKYDADKEEELKKIAAIPSEMPWSNVIAFWRLNQTHCTKKDRFLTEKSKEAAAEKKALKKQRDADRKEEAWRKLKPVSGEEDISFRVSAHRVGKKQSITSPEAESKFGGALNDATHWKVDMVNYSVNVNMNLGASSLTILISLTGSSLHRRNISHYGITTLRGTIAYNMARVCKIQPGDIVFDPMCGSGCISIEAAIDWPGTFNIAADNAYPAVQRAANNVKHLNKHGHKLAVDVINWDVTDMPLRTNSVDVIVTDMPFGKRIGSVKDNIKMYPAALTELARIARPGVTRGCFLTRDKRSMGQALNQNVQYWTRTESFFINIGGLKALVYVLKRTKKEFVAKVAPEAAADVVTDVPAAAVPEVAAAPAVVAAGADEPPVVSPCC